MGEPPGCRSGFGECADGQARRMGYLIAALIIILAIVVAVAVAKLLIGLLVVAAGVAAAVYIWYRLKDPLHRPHPVTPTEQQHQHR